MTPVMIAPITIAPRKDPIKAYISVFCFSISYGVSSAVQLVPIKVWFQDALTVPFRHIVVVQVVLIRAWFSAVVTVPFGQAKLVQF